MFKKWIINRLKEPSTWKAIVVLSGISGIWAKPEMIEQYALISGSIIAFIEFIRKEKADAGTTPPADK